MSWLIWILAPIIYGLFCLWYINWKVPFTQDEIDKFMGRFAGLEAGAIVPIHCPIRPSLGSCSFELPIATG